MIRLLYFTHRWVGVALALFMVLWFSSGLIITYSNPVLTTREQQLAHAQVLNPEMGWLSLGEALALNAKTQASQDHETEEKSAHQSVRHGGPSDENAIVSGRLARADDTPVWRIEKESGKRFAISALDGTLHVFSTESAARIAQQWLAAQASPSTILPAVTYIDTFDTASTLRNYQNFRPFHRFAVNDGHGTEIIVSGKTGEVLQAATRFERGLNYAGNWLHLFRPLDLINTRDIRHDALMYAGLFAFIASVTGLIIGWLRWKPGFFGKPTYSKGRTQPYREFWLRYHFWTGLIGGTFAIFWAFSGTLSTNPGHIFSEAAASPEELARFHGAEWPSIIASWKPEAASGKDDTIVELDWNHVGDAASLLAYSRNGQRTAWAIEENQTQFDESVLLAAAQRLAGERTIASHALLTDYDSYYYPNRRQGHIEKPLPVLRVDLADAGHTSLYIDPQDGRLITKMDNSRRAYRWLYTALHHWDFGWLHKRPVWTLWTTTWALLGLVMSVSSAVLGWRRLRRTIRAKMPAPQLGEEVSAVRS